MKLLRDYPEKILIGKNQENEPIYFYRPSWDCNWYWGFGYIGNDNLHTHLNSLGKNNLYENIKNYFSEFRLQDKDIWLFCEYVMTVYALRPYSEVIRRGGSYYSHNPHKDVIKNPDEYKRINSELIPLLIDEIYKLLGV